MKNSILSLTLFVFLGITSAFSQFIPDTVFVGETLTAPEIDGEVDELWEDVPFVNIEHWGDDDDGFPNEVPEADDFEAKFKLIWDEEYIYCLGVITDDYISSKEDYVANESKNWETDNFEFYWAPTNTQKEDASEMMQVRLSFANPNTDDGCVNVQNGWSPGGFTLPNFVTANRALSSDGWVLEAKFELAALASSISEDHVFEEGSILGLNINACDNDNEEKRKHIGSWVEDARYDQADTLGVIKLVYEVPTAPTAISASNVENINFYPNPANSYLKYPVNNSIKAIEIVNAIGVNVLATETINGQIDISSFPAGIYMVKCTDNNNLIQVKKILKK